MGCECHRKLAFYGRSASAVFKLRLNKNTRKSVFNVVDFLLFDVFNILFGVFIRM